MSSEVLLPNKSADFIAKHSKDVTIDNDRLESLTQKLLKVFTEKEYSLKSWKDHEAHPQVASRDAIEWIFLADTLNFSFWLPEEEDKFGVMFKGKLETGYCGLPAAINRAIKEGIPITSAKYYSSMSKDDLCHFLRSDTNSSIPLIDERLRVLREAGEILMKHYDGSFATLVEQCNRSAQKLVSEVVKNFPSYRDEADFNGRKVSFYKRAQILVADIWACFEGTGLGAFDDIESITMFADYRVPQVLNYFGVLKYSEALQDRLTKGEMFTSGERQEVELRGCCIWAVELLRDKLSELMGPEAVARHACCSTVIDYYLWDYRRLHVKEVDVVPYHKIRCIYY